MASQVNYGILNQVKYPEPRVVASGTSTKSSAGAGSSLSSLAGGIVSGMKAGAEIKVSNAAVAMSNENLKEKQAAFPDQLHMLHNSRVQSDMNLAGAQQSAQDQADLRAAALKGPDAYANKLQQISPAAYQDYRLKMLDNQKKFSDISKTDADTAKEEASNYTGAINIAGQVVRAAAAGKTPQQQQQIYQFGLSQLPKKIQSVMPPQYDAQSGMAISRLSYENQMENMATKIEGENKSNLLKNQTMRDVVQSRIDNINKQGPAADPMSLQQLTQTRDELNRAVAIDPELTGKDKKDKIDPNSTEALTNKAIGNNDQATLKNVENTKAPLKTFATDVSNVESILNRIPKGFVGKLQDLTKVNINNTDIQILQHHFSSMGYLAKNVMANMTAGMRLTNTELGQLNNIVGGTSVNWDTNKAIMNDMKGKLLEKAHDNWKDADSIYSKGDQSVYGAWRERNPEPINPTSSGTLSPYTHNGQPVPYDALNKARWDNPDLSEKQVVDKFGLSSVNPQVQQNQQQNQAAQQAIQAQSAPQQQAPQQQGGMPQQGQAPQQMPQQAAPIPQDNTQAIQGLPNNPQMPIGAPQ